MRLLSSAHSWFCGVLKSFPLSNVSGFPIEDNGRGVLNIVDWLGLGPNTLGRGLSGLEVSVRSRDQGSWIHCLVRIRGSAPFQHYFSFPFVVQVDSIFSQFILNCYHNLFASYLIATSSNLSRLCESQMLIWCNIFCCTVDNQGLLRILIH